jgi:hypothetical protein
VISASHPTLPFLATLRPYDHLRIFGCACHPILSARIPHKLVPRYSRCVFLGYFPNHKGYLLSILIVCSLGASSMSQTPPSLCPHLAFLLSRTSLLSLTMWRPLASHLFYFVLQVRPHYYRMRHRCLWSSHTWLPCRQPRPSLPQHPRSRIVWPRLPCHALDRYG